MDNYIQINTMKQLGMVVRRKRQNDGLTQQECATLANVGTRFLSELERGKTTIEFGKMLQAIESLGLNLFLKARSAKG